jgi:hypothetical protein
MRRWTLLVGALLATAAAAEVSVDVSPAGVVDLHFEPTTRGPWTRVRQDQPVGRILNETGDARRDGWPAFTRNGATGAPEAAWASAADSGEIWASWFDGKAWVAPRNVSQDPSLELNPDVASDRFGNRFFAWQVVDGSGESAIVYRAMRLDGNVLTHRAILSQLDDRRPSLDVDPTGDVYAAYEERDPQGDSSASIAIDWIRPARDGYGRVRCSGENSPDLMRAATIRTQLAAGSSLVPNVQVQSEASRLWVTWVDSPSSVGFVQMLARGTFSAPQYRPFDPLAGDAVGRALFRREVLAP